MDNLRTYIERKRVETKEKAEMKLGVARERLEALDRDDPVVRRIREKKVKKYEVMIATIENALKTDAEIATLSEGLVLYSAIQQRVLDAFFAIVNG